MELTVRNYARLFLRRACLVAFLLLDTSAYGACVDQQVAAATVSTTKGAIEVEAVACSRSDATGNVAVSVYFDQVHVETFHINYESTAYVLALDTTIKFDCELVQGLGIRTGKGRDGTGMHCWKIPAAGFPIVDLGDAPELIRDRFMPNAYSTLISSTGEYYAIRYFYEIENNRLVPARSVGFAMEKPKVFTATLEDLKPSGEKIVKGRRTLSERSAERCMNGSTSCW
jgi:hypothetical protein